MLHFLLLLAIQHPDTAPPESWAPHRVYDARHHRFSDFESLALAASRSDVVFLGEHHDDPATHRMELALLQAVARRRGNVVLGLEMFERDVQPILDGYLAGRVSEEAFLRQARPWPNYMADYRPLIEFAKAHGWKVVAGNVPRRLASAVANQGLEAITRNTDSTRAWAAAEFRCPHDDYFRRFAAAMSEHPMGGPGQSPAESAAMTERFYQAQCVKDETMAESVARARRDPGQPLVIHYNGDFHSDYGEGTAARTRRRLDGDKVLIVTAIPLSSLDSVDVKHTRKQGDWLLFTLKPTT